MGNVGAVFMFEWKRSLTLPRMAWWLVLAGFPIFIIGVIRFSINATMLEHELPDPAPREVVSQNLKARDASKEQKRPDPAPRELWIGFLFALGPMLVTMLGTMLWVTPALSAELERRSWVYLSVRPNGGTAVLVGKYLAAVTWVIPPVLLGLAVAVPLSAASNGWQIWWTMARLVLLSTPAYAAVYLVLGTIIPRRGMVLAVGYSLLFELVISFVPAVINKLTVHHHLQALLLQWCELDIPPEFMSGAISLIGNTPPWQHVAILLMYPPILVGTSIGILRACEFSSSAESDV
ncbi:MAG TPA: ABC transporter permease subunit [Schlesneria sp.]|jgi:ABC-type transport system involved in multi-copper enzyme maturation permease subunit